MGWPVCLPITVSRLRGLMIAAVGIGALACRIDCVALKMFLSLPGLRRSRRWQQPECHRAATPRSSGAAGAAQPSAIKLLANAQSPG